ncbi:MAG: PEP-CTERM sorting domain-containing protein [Verrucomicrobiota bacterium]
MPFKALTAFIAFFALSTAISNAVLVTLISEDFESLPDQAGAPISIFGTNEPLGETTDATYSSPGAAISIRNGMRSMTVQPDVAFTGNTSNRVGQLITHTSGGFGLISVPLLSNQPIPITVGPLTEGDIIRISFDYLVQTAPTNASLGFFWNSNSASGTQNTTWDEAVSANASPGDVLSITKELVIDATTTDITEIGPQFQIVGGTNVSSVPGHDGSSTNINLGQIDNFVLEVDMAIPEPSSVIFLLFSGLACIIRRRR